MAVCVCHQDSFLFLSFFVRIALLLPDFCYEGWWEWIGFEYTFVALRHLLSRKTVFSNLSKNKTNQNPPSFALLKMLMISF